MADRLDSRLDFDPKLKSITIPATVTSLDMSSFNKPVVYIYAHLNPGSEGGSFRAETNAESFNQIRFAKSPEVSHRFKFQHFRMRNRYAFETITFEPGSQLCEIGGSSFAGCSALKSICLPASVEKINGQSFIDCGLTNIEIESGNKFYHIQGHFVMDLKNSQIVRYFGSASRIDIPDTIEVLDRFSFYSLHSVHHVLFGPNSKLSRIKRRTFAECRGLRSIRIPSFVSRGGQGCFMMCRSLRTVSFCSESRLSRFGDSAFAACLLESITLPSSVEILGRGCFQACNKLVTIAFAPDSKLRRIEQAAFAGCKSLQGVALPSSVEYVGWFCFANCRAMSSVEFSAPCHLRELMDLPPNWRRLIELPDSLEVLGLWSEYVACAGCFQMSGYAVDFGRESKLVRISTRFKRSYLRVSGRSLKVFRGRLEFDEIQ
jgi:hypothetical protein